MTDPTAQDEKGESVTLRKGDRLFLGTALVEISSVAQDGTITAWVREAGTVPDEVAP